MLLLAFLSACHPQRTPLGVAERYVRAAQASRPSARRWLAAPQSTLADRELIAELRAAWLRGTIVTRAEPRRAKVPTGSDEPIALVEVEGDYRLARDPLDAYPRQTAEQCLRSFVRAIDTRRYERLADFVPERYRRTMEARVLKERLENATNGGPLVELLGLLRGRLDQPLDYYGPDEARLAIDERRTVRLTRQPGGWVVESFD